MTRIASTRRKREAKNRHSENRRMGFLLIHHNASGDAKTMATINGLVGMKLGNTYLNLSITYKNTMFAYIATS